MEERLIIRADADSQMGTGHIMRSIALGQAWQKNGGRVSFVTSCPMKSLTNRIKAQGFDLWDIEPDHLNPEDKTATLKLLKKQHSAWMVVDGYQFQPDYHLFFRNNGYKIIIMDDYNHLPFYNADILVNQNPSAHGFSYRSPVETVRLLGPAYTLLRQEFIRQGDKKRNFPRTAKKILITMGGADTMNTTLVILRAMTLLQEKKLFVKVVLGPAFEHRHSLQSQTASWKIPHEFITAAEEMPELMEWADMAVSAGGSTSWELLFMGVPALFLINAENQERSVGEIESKNAGINLGRHDDTNPTAIAAKLDLMIHCQKLRKAISRAGQKLITGRGAIKVIKAMTKKLNHPQL